MGQLTALEYATNIANLKGNAPLNMYSAANNYQDGN